MNFKKTKEQLTIKKSARIFAETYIKPKAYYWDNNEIFPKELLHNAGELGFMGILIPKEYGGLGLGYIEYADVIEEISKVDPSIGLSIAAHNSLPSQHIYKFGTKEQKEKWLPKLASGKWIGSWGLTEENTGSDAGNMDCVAVKDGDGWLINGVKKFITHGKSSDITVVVVRTGDRGDSHGMTAFVVERGTRGFSSGKVETKIGMRASETAEMVFKDCWISDENRLGEIGEGFIQSMKILDGGRISIAALSLGIAKGAYECALNYSNKRVQFGKPISSFQSVGFKLADMATEIEASELLIQKASIEKSTKLSAMCKMYASEVCVKIANEAMQILGGYGFVKGEYPVERFLRDSKLCTIGEGTTEIQKLVIFRKINNESRKV
jgi:alkylation response protein AidB-like acyl-CoA dehydrogenase